MHKYQQGKLAVTEFPVSMAAVVGIPGHQAFSVTVQGSTMASSVKMVSLEINLIRGDYNFFLQKLCIFFLFIYIFNVLLNITKIFFLSISLDLPRCPMFKRWNMYRCGEFVSV